MLQFLAQIGIPSEDQSTSIDVCPWCSWGTLVCLPLERGMFLVQLPIFWWSKIFGSFPLFFVSLAMHELDFVQDLAGQQQNGHHSIFLPHFRKEKPILKFNTYYAIKSRPNCFYNLMFGILTFGTLTGFNYFNSLIIFLNCFSIEKIQEKVSDCHLQALLWEQPTVWLSSLKSKYIKCKVKFWTQSP